MLYIFSGLPGTGKSTLAQLLARQVSATYLRIDTIEQTLRELCSIDIQGEGYQLAYRIAADNLRLGVGVVADSCNQIELTRREWERVAQESGAPYVNIEVICSNLREHQQRVETRQSTIPGMPLPTWADVCQRTYDNWTVDRVLVETSGRSEQECLDELLTKVSALNRPPHQPHAAELHKDREKRTSSPPG